MPRCACTYEVYGCGECVCLFSLKFMAYKKDNKKVAIATISWCWGKKVVLAGISDFLCVTGRPKI